MFDPTIYENIKVVFEGEVYELDLAGEIAIINRQDIVDLAHMNRRYIITFKLSQSSHTQMAEIELHANVEDLSKEILESPNTKKPGCEITVKFYIHVKSQMECEAIEHTINQVWDNRPHIVQTLSFVHDNQHKGYFDEIRLGFGRKIDEDNINDIHHLLKYTVMTLKELNKYT